MRLSFLMYQYGCQIFIQVTIVQKSTNVIFSGVCKIPFNANKLQKESRNRLRLKVEQMKHFIYEALLCTTVEQQDQTS